MAEALPSPYDVGIRPKSIGVSSPSLVSRNGAIVDGDPGRHFSARSLSIRPARKAGGAMAPLRLELVDLETFAAVAALGSFSAAARQINITQPSVTSRIQRLELSLGTKLLIRTPRKVELTGRGSLLRAEAAQGSDTSLKAGLWHL